MMINFNKINKKTFLELFMVLTSLTIIIVYLYLRITRKQRVIDLIPQEINLHYNVFLYFFGISCFILVLLLWTLYLKRRKHENNVGYFGKLIFKLYEIKNKINIFYKSYVIVFHYLSPKYTQHLVTYANNIMAYSKNKNATLILVSVLVPRLLILCVFIFELYQKTLHYYFFSLLLLLIPLFFRFLLFIYSDIHKQVLPELLKLVDINPDAGKVEIETPEGKKTFGTIGFRFKVLEGDKPDDNYNIDHFMFNYYNPMLFIGPHMELTVLPLYYKINTITMWIYALIQAAGWAYVLFYLV